MINNMKKNCAGFILVIFCILQYGKKFFPHFKGYGPGLLSPDSSSCTFTVINNWSRWQIGTGNNMSRLEIDDCNMEAEWPLDCRRKAKKLKGALQGTGGACRNAGAETG